METEMDAENGNCHGIKLAHAHKNSHEVVTVVRKPDQTHLLTLVRLASVSRLSPNSLKLNFSLEREFGEGLETEAM